jgi:ubiquitin carboxyl-terminal hydrolase 5/13
MGFSRRRAEIAVQNTQSSNAEEVLDWLLAHMDDPALDAQELEPQPTPSVPKQEREYKDGPSKYKLRGFITHMGSSPHSGHYVCHLLRNGVWYLYNDEKVAVSQNPPKALGYIYLYEQEE